MLIELLLFLPLIMLWYFNIIGWKIITLITIFCYWIPKWFFIDNIISVFFPLVLTRGRSPINHNHKQISLTFDDMPYGESSQDIIKLLDKHKMIGTFFIISDYINSTNKQILVDAVKSGHQLGNHGKTNSMHLLSFDLEKEIVTCDNIIKEIYREANVELPKKMMYRPGCGLFSIGMLKLVDKLNYKLALGSVYPNDPIIRSSLINYYYLINHIEIDDVVILHDRI